MKKEDIAGGAGASPGREGRVVRTPRDPRKRLDPRLEELARGDSRRIQHPRGQPRLKDERSVRCVPGVSNRDARRLFDARVAELQRAVAAHAGGEGAQERGRLARALAEAVALRLWRGRSLVSFEAFAEQILVLPADVARELAAEGAGAHDLPDEHGISDEAVASWMRAEVALLESECEGQVWVTVRAREERLHIELPARAAPPGLTEIGKRLAPLASDFEARRRDERRR